MDAETMEHRDFAEPDETRGLRDMVRPWGPTKPD